MAQKTTTTTKQQQQQQQQRSLKSMTKERDAILSSYIFQRARMSATAAVYICLRNVTCRSSELWLRCLCDQFLENYIL